MPLARSRLVRALAYAHGRAAFCIETPDGELLLWTCGWTWQASAFHLAKDKDEWRQLKQKGYRLVRVLVHRMSARRMSAPSGYDAGRDKVSHKEH